MRSRSPLLFLVFFGAVLPGGVATARVAVTTCGQVVQGQAFLAADLDCSTHPGHALVLDGALMLNGFTLTGNASDPAGYSAVDCTGKCRVKIKGPGTIVGGATAVSGAKVGITREVVVRDAGEFGIRGATVKVMTSWVHHNGFALAVGPGGGGGISGGKIQVMRSTIGENASFGIDASVQARVKHASVMGHPIADIRSFEKPTVVDVNCLLSRRASLAETWGVCLGE